MSLSLLPVAFQNQPNMTRLAESLSRARTKKESIILKCGDTVKINQIGGQTAKINAITSLFGITAYNVNNIYYAAEDLTFVAKG